MSEFIPIRFGKYLLLDKIAFGGMAQLYRAKITGAEGFEKLIVIKMIHPHLSGEKELISAFIDEAKLAALLSHQNIVQIYDFGLMENSYFIAMEYLPGKDLRHILYKALRKGMPLSLEYALYITSQICSGLDYAHKLTDLKGKPLKIIHRDISPQNILITYEGDVKIVDFGIAKAASLSSVTPDGRLKGKAPYMSPEQAAGEKVDRRSDIFSTGILLYELVTQRRMFTGEVMEILAKVRRAEFEAPESVRGGLSPKIYEILHRALAKEVDRRYKSCGEMLVDIEECMFELSWRPTDRGLAEYMKNLFGDEMEDEGPWTVPERPRGGQDWEKVKTGIKEEGSIKRRKQGILYLTLPVLLIVVALIWIFGSREKPVNALNQESFWPPASSSSNDPTLNEALSKKAQKRPGHHTEAQALQEKAAGLVEKRPEEAKSLLLRAVELDPKNVQAHFQLGLAYTALKNSPKAIDAYQKVIELEPRYPDAYFNLGYILSMNKNYSKAEEMYSQVVKLAPAYLDEALFNLSVVQEKQGKRKESIGNLERALKVNPKNELAQKFLKRLKGVS